MSKISDKLYYEKNKERISARNKLWKKNNSEKVKEHRRITYRNNHEKVLEKSRLYRSSLSPERKLKLKLRPYGLSVEEFIEIVDKQENKCAICGEKPKHNRRLAIDHNHITGQVRGLLCFKCNSSIGLLGEDLSILNKIIEYLNFHNGNK